MSTTEFLAKVECEFHEFRNLLAANDVAQELARVEEMWGRVERGEPEASAAVRVGLRAG